MGEALQGLIDKQALHELALKYCRACDRRDFALLRSLYHDDAIDDHGAMFCGSADEYLAWLPGVLANFEATVHSITNALYAVRGDEAQGELYTLAYHRTCAPAAREITIGGRYLDRYARRDGVWKFAHRSSRSTGVAARRSIRPPTASLPPVRPRGAPMRRIPPTWPCPSFVGSTPEP